MTDATQAQAADTEKAFSNDVGEYGSVTITIDHLNREGREDGHIVTKVVFSTETAFESIIAQVNYFAKSGRGEYILDNPELFAVIGAGTDKDVAYVYTPNENQTNIIVDGDLHAKVLSHPLLNPEGTLKGLHVALITLATDMRKAAVEEGKDPTVLVYLPEAL